VLELGFEGEDKIVHVHSKELYDEAEGYIDKYEVWVDIKYKTIAKKVKPIAIPLPSNYEEKVERATMQLNLRDLKKIGYEFTDMALDGLKVEGENFLTEVKARSFEEMLIHHVRAFAFEPHKIGCIDPGVVALMIIFMIPHVPWNLRPIPRAHLPQLIELFYEKIKMGILKPSIAPYSNR